MFKSKGTKSAKSGKHAPAASDSWHIVAGKENIARRDGHNDVELPPPGVLVKEAPWAGGSGRGGNGRGRPRTSSLPQVEMPSDMLATDAMEKHAMNRAFERMLDDLQIPSATRSKLSTLDTPVKAAMLKSSHVLNLEAPLEPPPSIGQLRKSRSSTSLDSPRPDHSRSKSMFNDIPYEPHPPASSLGAAAGLSIADDVVDIMSRGSAPWMRNEYATSSSSLGRSTSPAPASTMSSGSQVRPVNKPKDKEREKDLTPAAFASMLNNTICTSLDVERLKKLRLMLRNESAGWTELFIRERGYSALLSRLTDMLNVEWREEQRDDKILHELFRCIKALSTSSIGCFALRTSCPTPWSQLIVLLYSDKKPGDVGTRQEMIDIFQLLFELYPVSPKGSEERTKSPTPSGSSASGLPRPLSSTSTPPPSTPPFSVAGHSSLFSLIRSLLLTPAPLPAEQTLPPIQPHSFISSLHTPRIFKTYVQEMSDVCRDYFWVFCHPQNTIWSLRDTDVRRVEAPRAPGGMTGGVEWEAVGYLTSHLRFVNSLSQAAAAQETPEDELSARRFHSDMFASGFERVLVTARKASTAYYPTLHLEIARYVSHAASTGFEIPWSLGRYVGLPPSNVINTGTSVSTSGSGAGGPGSKTGAKIQISGAVSQPSSPTKQVRPVVARGAGGGLGVQGGQLPPIKPISPMK